MLQKSLNNNMPLKKGKSQKTSKVTTSKPKSKKAAAKQTAAVSHAKSGKVKKKKIDEAKKNDGNLANNYPPYDKVTKGDIIAGAKNEDQQGGKDKKNKKSLKESFDAVVKSVLRKIFIAE